MKRNLSERHGPGPFFQATLKPQRPKKDQESLSFESVAFIVKSRVFFRFLKYDEPKIQKHPTDFSKILQIHATGVRSRLTTKKLVLLTVNSGGPLKFQRDICTHPSAHSSTGRWFRYVCIHPKYWEDSHFDKYFSDPLVPRR